MLTPEEFASKMKECFAEGDGEASHSDADDLLCNLLRELGYGEAIDIFEAAEKWYA